jgi:hypothetical protein
VENQAGHTVLTGNATHIGGTTGSVSDNITNNTTLAFYRSTFHYIFSMLTFFT